MARLTLDPGEEVLAHDGVQLAKGFPQTAGELYLTNRRLVLDPNQFMSMGFGKRLEIPLARITSFEQLGRFQGGTFVGSAGKKIAVGLDDGSTYTFSFYLNSDIDVFYAAFSHRSAHVPASAPPAAGAPRTFPKPRRTVWFWLNIVATAAGAAMLVYALRDVIRRW